MQMPQVAVAVVLGLLGKLLQALMQVRVALVCSLAIMRLQPQLVILVTTLAAEAAVLQSMVQQMLAVLAAVETAQL
jgi:hypothetical protein